MGWLSFIKSKDFDPAAFERDLSTLASKIARSERNITKYQYQVKRLRGLFIIYGTLIYLAVLTYTLAIHRFKFSELEWTQQATVVLFPGVVVAVYKLIRVLYRIKISRVQTYVESLRSQHSEKIEDLKERTKYSSTQALLQRFSDGNDLNALVDEELQEKQKQLDEMKAALEPGNKPAFNAYPNASKGWLDSIVEAVVGSDELNPSQRYALICGNCSSHNGLAPPNQLPDSVRYICPRCGFINNNNKVELKSEGEQVTDPVQKNDKIEPLKESATSATTIQSQPENDGQAVQDKKL